MNVSLMNIGIRKINGLFISKPGDTGGHTGDTNLNNY